MITPSRTATYTPVHHPSLRRLHPSSLSWTYPLHPGHPCRRAVCHGTWLILSHDRVSRAFRWFHRALPSGSASFSYHVADHHIAHHRISHFPFALVPPSTSIEASTSPSCQRLRWCQPRQCVPLSSSSTAWVHAKPQQVARMWRSTTVLPHSAGVCDRGV